LKKGEYLAFVRFNEFYNGVIPHWAEQYFVMQGKIQY